MNKHKFITRIAMIFTVALTGLTAANAAAPANDSWAGATIVTSTGVAYLGDNSEATKEGGEPNHALNSGGRSVWYKYTATADGYITVYTTSSSFDTTLAVYKGFSLANLYLLAACDDLIPVTNTRSRVTVATRTGDVYYIAVDGHNEGGTVASGGLVVEFEVGTVASNDSFANAISLNGNGGEQSTSNVNATKEAGEPNHAGELGGRSLWYKFSAPVGATKSYTFSLRGSTTQGGLNPLYTVMAVYTGASVNALTPVVSDGGYSRVTFIPMPGITYYIAFDTKTYAEPALSAGTMTLKYGVTKSTQAADFDRDDKADILIFRPNSGNWYSIESITGSDRSFQWGLGTDIPIAADLDQDARTDLNVFRPETGTWYVRQSKLNGAPAAFQWGLSGDIPQIHREGNYSYATVFRPSNGTWYIRLPGTPQIVRFGSAGDIPVMADYDGDGVTDVAVFRPSTGVWYWINSSNGQVAARQFGLAGDRPVAADYDKDGRVDIAVYRPSNGVWYVFRSLNNSVQSVQWGIPEDIPQPGDYDGDNQADMAVFRPSNGTWYIRNSASGTARILTFGLTGDKPVTTTNFVH